MLLDCYWEYKLYGTVIDYVNHVSAIQQENCKDGFFIFIFEQTNIMYDICMVLFGKVTRNNRRNSCTKSYHCLQARISFVDIPQNESQLITV